MATALADAPADRSGTVASAAADLELINVNKTYPNGTRAVIDFNLRVAKGEFISFLGPSGCGKTTTLRMIGGFEDITDGDILIRQKVINHLPAEKRPTAMVFQNYALFPHLSVRGNMEFGLKLKGMAGPERKKKLDSILETVGLTGIQHHKVGRLSGGQRQRIALARGLVMEPDILLLDEPLGSLDANLRKEIQNEIKILQRDLGITFVFVTHAQSEALVLSDRIVVMNRGRVEQIAAPQDMYTRPATEFVARFIGRNTIFEGSVRGVDGATAGIDTEVGVLSGANHLGGLAAGAGGVIVVPSEAMHLHDPAAEDAASLAQRYGPNLIEATVASVAVAGHGLYVDLMVSSGRRITLSTSTGKYDPSSLTSGMSVALGFDATEATALPKQTD